MNKTFNILSIDGGGILGLYSADILERIEHEYCNDEPLSKHFNLITGTSTGGIIALALSVGASAKEIKQFYLRHGEKIFPKKKRDCPGLFKNKYSNKNLKNALKEFFGNKTIKDCRNYVCIPSIDVATCQPIMFKTNNNGQLCRDENTLLVDIALATSAAPTYFPIHSFDSFLGLVDGGLWQNNPTLYGIIEAISYFVGNGKEYDKIKILSLGNPSSCTRTGISTKNHNSSILKWNANLVTLPMKISSIATTQIVSFLYKTQALNIEKYLRIEPQNLSTNFLDLKLDSADEESYKKILAQSSSDFNQNKNELHNFFMEEK